jgi:predicted ATPase/DNA-binding winged helix-turn-helix (wHTH) protein
MLLFDRAGVDVAARVVELDGVPQHLEPQAFDLLAYLIAHRNRVVPKAELLDEIWGDQFVSESSLTTRIKEVRRALGDDGARQQIVRNYRGRGYRFVADPSARAARASDHDRPVPVVNALRGRSDEIGEVTELLERSPVVTLTGPGGVGKTALALQIARHVERRYDDGVAVVHLAPVVEASGVMHVLRRAVGLSDAETDEAQLIDALAELDILLVVDNCEHLIDEVARVVEAIASGGGPARVLATSRERLSIGSEQVRPVEPLDPAAARELLIERAGLLQPGWSADESSVDRLVDLVDRLPLAIEMAAAHLSTIGVEELLELLEGRLDLLRSPHRTAENRHATLPAVIEWSENLLDAEARRLLADLSVFAGPVTAPDVATVVDADLAELVTGPLADLVEHSLVVADTSRQPTRYHMLETVRACVAGRRARAVDERHARHVAEAVRAADRALRTPDEPAAVARLDSLIPEIRAAHRWARTNDIARAASITASLLHYAHERQWSEPAAWSRQLLDLTGDAGEHAAPAAASLAADASNRGAYDMARALASIAIDGDDPIVASSAHDTLANVGIYSGDLESAGRHAAALLSIAERTGDTTIWTLGVLDEVLSLLYSGRIDLARSRLDEHTPPGPVSPTCAAWLAYASGEILAAQDRLTDAIACFDEAAHLSAPVGNQFVTSVATVSALAARSRGGDTDEALAAFAPVLAHYRRIRSLTHGVTALRNLTVLLVRSEQDEAATVLLGTLTSPDVKSTYGAESELLADARRAVTARNPADAITAWTEEGRSHDAIWALDYAIDLLPDR